MNVFRQALQLFQSLSDPVRLRIVRLVAAHQEVCVCELVDSLEEPQYVVSRHLSELRESGMVTAEREGRWMYYSLADDPTVHQVARLVLELPHEPFALDEQRFEARLNLRVAARCRTGIQRDDLADSAGDSAMEDE